MYSKEEAQRLEIKLNKLFDDPIEQVSQKSGKSRPTVSKFLKGAKVRPSSAEQIYDACIELIEEKENKRQTNVKRTKRLDAEVEDSPQTSMNI